MARRQIEVSADHVWGGFKWRRPPDCRCGELRKAVEDRIVFVSDEMEGEGASLSNVFYMLPVAGDGFFALSEGVSIDCCPWCGDKIVGTKL